MVGTRHAFQALRGAVAPAAAVGIAAAALALALPAPVAAAARPKVTPEQISAWGACAAEKNAGDVAWMYMIFTDQSGLKGRDLQGAFGYAVGGMTRDCVPEGTAMDGDMIEQIYKQAAVRWAHDLGKASMPRAIDPWADCMADKYPAKGRAYLFVTDFAFAGPRIIVEGVDPAKAIYDPTPECEALKPANVEGANRTHLYARLNYVLRVKPRLPAVPAGEKH